jgi:PAS domain S-box-containing protein
MYIIQKRLNKPVNTSDEITYSKEEIETLRKSEESYRNIVNNVQDVFYRSNSEGKLIMISNSVRNILGYDSAEEYIGINIAEEMYYYPEERDKLIELLRRDGSVSDYETTLRRKDGSPVIVSTSSHFYYDDNGNVAGVEGVVRDITARKHAEEMFNTAFNDNPCPMSISDIETGFYIEANKALLESLEFDRSDIIGHTAPEIGIYRNIEERNKIVESIKTTGHAHNFEIEFVSKTGKVKNGIFFGEIINVVGKKMLLSSVLNVTGQREAENQLKTLNEELAAANEELKASNEEFEAMNVELISANEELAVKEKELLESEAKYRTLVDNLSAGIIIYDSDENIIFSNQSSAKMLGLEISELLGANRKYDNWEMIGEDRRPIPHEMNPHLQTFSTGKPLKNFILGIRQPDRTEHIWLLCNTYPVKDQDGSLIQVVTTFIDLTERKIAEEEARRLKNYLNNIIDSNPDMLIGMDSEMKITLINRRTENFAGITIKEAIGKPLETILPDFTQTIESMLSQIVNSQPVSNQGLLLEKNSENRYYNLTLYPLISTGVEGAVILIMDVTDSIKKEDQLRQAQKMETVGTLAGGLAHDFNNVLSGIVGTTSLILHLIEKDKIINARFKNYIDVIDKSGNRAAEMVQQLLTLSRKTEISLIPLDLKKSLMNVVQICRNTFDKSIEILTEYTDSPAIIKGDPSQVEQVLLNLCINASHAMTIMRKENEKQGGSLTLSIRNITADKHFCSTHPEASAGNYWVVSQSDTGVGIDAVNLHKIFDPFFTTKERDSGTGLGLAMVYSILHNHGGLIDVYSEPGTGSTFNIYFPELTEDGACETSVQECRVEKGDELVLVIDDEEIVRLTAESILAECGYEVILAGSGREGISIFSTRKNDVQCVLLDMAMPVMSGKEVYLELKKIKPEVKVLLASGFRQDGRVQETLALGVNGFIQKPYSITELSKKIKNLIV